MPLRKAASTRAKALGFVEEDVLDVTSETILGIKMDKVWMRRKNACRYFVNGQEVSGFSVSLEGKNRKSLFVSITKLI